MRCKCNPSRAEFGDWRGAARCAFCGKIFHTGWKCLPKCETVVFEGCLPECLEKFVQEERPAECEQTDAEKNLSECPLSEMEELAHECREPSLEECPESEEEGRRDEAEPRNYEPPQESEPYAQMGEWTRVFPGECLEEPPEAATEQDWLLDDLTDQLPPDPH